MTGPLLEEIQYSPRIKHYQHRYLDKAELLKYHGCQIQWDSKQTILREGPVHCDVTITSQFYTQNGWEGPSRKSVRILPHCKKCHPGVTLIIWSTHLRFFRLTAGLLTNKWDWPVVSRTPRWVWKSDSFWWMKSDKLLWTYGKLRIALAL